MIPGFDCYVGYGLIDFNLVREAGYRFVWVKCVEGNEGKDPAYARNVQRARDAGLVVGAYHFAFPLPTDPKHPGRSPLEQARAFYDGCAGLGSQVGELSPALDFEWPPRFDKTKFLDKNGNGKRDPDEPLVDQWARWGVTAASLSEWARECAEAMTILWGRRPVIYTYPSFFKAVAAGADVSWAQRYPLWLADYQWSGPGTPPDGWTPPHMSWVAEGWDDWAACQHSAEGSTVRIPGVPACPVDRNVIKDEATFQALCGYVDSDPDAETQPNFTPSARPAPPHHHALSRMNEALDASREAYRRERDSEPPPPDDAA
jgi:GH25 family lysozyme M1 (1,4-beta-N-acetylmuramidase)